VGCNVIEDSLFTSHLDFFPPNLGTVNDKHGEWFQQDISTMEKRYARKSSQNMCAEYFWKLSEEVSIASYKRMSDRKKL